MEETISLKELFDTLRKRLSLILVLAFIFAGGSAIYSFFIATPVYQVSTDMLVNRSQVAENYNSNELNTNIQFINTYSDVIKSSAILDIVSEELNGEYTTNQLKNMLSIKSGQSQVFTIVIKDESAQNAAIVANKIAEVFQREIPNIMNVDNVSILEKAVATDNISPIQPKPTLNIAIALVVGLMAGVGLAFLLEYLDNTMKTEQDIDQHLGIPVLGVIMNFEVEQTVEAEAAPTLSRSARGERR